jgi:hypothetical protein
VIGHPRLPDGALAPEPGERQGSEEDHYRGVLERRGWPAHRVEAELRRWGGGGAT